MLSTWPAAEPFWVIDEVADGDAKLVSDRAGAERRTRSHVMSVGVAPLAHVAGPVIATSGAPAPVSDAGAVERQRARRERDRRAGVPPVTSARGTVIV